MRSIGLLVVFGLTACGEESLQRSVVGRPTCTADASCATGLVCIAGYCEAPQQPLNAPEPKAQSGNAILESVGASPFDAESGAFSLTFSVPGSSAVSFADNVQRAKLRTRFTNGGVRVWGFEIDAPGGQVMLPTANGDRIYYMTNIKVRSAGEVFVPLVDGEFPIARATAPLDLDISADVGSEDTSTVRLTAQLEQVKCNFEFAPSTADGRLHVRVTVAEERDLYGPPGSGLSIEGLGTDADLAGVAIPERWIKR